MNKFCIIINSGTEYTQIHHDPNPKPNHSQVDQWIVDYFSRFKKQALRIDNYTVCEVVGQFTHHNTKIYVVKDLSSDKLVSIDSSGVLKFNNYNKSIFFDTLFDEK